MTDDELIALAIAHKLGRAMKPLGMQTGDVFVTDQSYRTGELLAFAAAVEDAARMEWMSRCQGKTHDGCAYLGHCGMVCNKCGNVA